MSSAPVPVPDATHHVAEESCGLRERKKRQTRQALHRAALEMVADRGMAQVTTEAIAERAGVSARTFFNYFPTKESAVLGMGPDEPERVGQWLRERPADESPTDAVRTCLTRYVLDLYSDPELWLLRRTIVRSDPSVLQAMAAVSTAVERRVAEALAERLGVDVDHDLRPSLLVAVTWAAIRAGLNHAREHGSPVTEVIDEALSMLDRVDAT